MQSYLILSVRTQKAGSNFSSSFTYFSDNYMSDTHTHTHTLTDIALYNIDRLELNFSQYFAHIHSLILKQFPRDFLGTSL